MNAPVLDHGLTPTVLAGEAILRAFAGRPHGQPFRDKAEIAAAAGRPVKNIGREIAALETGGLIRAPGLDHGEWSSSALTDAGWDAIAALDRAAGATVAELRVMPDMLFPNPMQPRKTFDQEKLEGLADSAEEHGDYEQALSVSPPDILGHRYIWEGERRWRASKILIARHGALPGRMAQGLRCIEREATDTEALFIGLVSNDQRESLPPLEDAFGLLALQEKTGWSGRQLAIKLGRAANGSEKGVTFVQRKLRVARHATPEAIAQYRLDGSWDALVDSCRASDDEPTVDPQADFFPPEAGELRPEPQADAPPPPTPAAPAVQAEDEPIELTALERLVLIEIAHAADAIGQTIGETAVRYVPAGKYWLDLAASSLQRQGLVGFKHHGRPYIWVTDAGREWLRDQNVTLPVVQDTLDWARERAGVDSEVGAYATAWLNPSPEDDAPADAPAAAQDAASEEDEAEEDQRAAQALTDAHAVVAGHVDPGLPEHMAWREILDRTRAPAPWTVTADFGVIFAADGSIACVVDQDNELRDDMAQARAVVIAAAVNRACGLIVASGEG